MYTISASPFPAFLYADGEVKGGLDAEYSGVIKDGFEEQ